MKILVDGDACPTKREIAEIGLKYGIEILYFCSLSHYSNNKYFSHCILVDNENQAVDMAIINHLSQGDIVITQDYGLASLVLSKKSYAMSFNGDVFTKDNIDLYLYQRYLALQQRKIKAKISKQPKRQEKEDIRFKKSLERLIYHLMNNPQ